MSEYNSIAVIPPEDFAERRGTGLLVPMGEGKGLQIVDCGDARPLTPAAEMHRTEQYGERVSPGRYFGGQAGLGVTALIAMTAQNGERFMSDFITEYSPEALAVFSADLASRASRRENSTVINLHSANGNEANELAFDFDLSADIQPGCKFLVYAGAVLMNAGGERSLEEADTITKLAGRELPVDEAGEAVQVLGAYLPPSFSVGRDAVRHAQEHVEGQLPHTILKGDAVQNEQTAVVIDMAGYRSNAGRGVSAGLPRYHHTPGLAASELPGLLPEYKLDASLLEASGLLLGAATRETLSGPDSPRALRTEVIPQEYVLAA